MATISGPRDVLRRFLRGECVTPVEMAKDLSPWEVCFDGTPDQARRWDALITAMQS